MTKAHDDNLRSFGQLPPTGGMGEEQIAELERLLERLRQTEGSSLWVSAYQHLSAVAVARLPALLAAAKGERGESLISREQLLIDVRAIISDQIQLGWTIEQTVDQFMSLQGYYKLERALCGPISSPPSHPDRREQYARIIAGEFIADVISSAAYGALGQTDWEEALSKADQILALPVPGEKWQQELIKLAFACDRRNEECLAGALAYRAHSQSRAEQRGRASAYRDVAACIRSIGVFDEGAAPPSAGENG